MIHEFNQTIYQGLEPFTDADRDTYLTTDAQFSFSLKKVTGASVLYAPIHCQLRRQCFNTLSQINRIEIITQKLHAAQLHVPISEFTNQPLQAITNAIDIGASHSVYQLTFSDHQSIVIKQEQLPNQTHFSQILSFLNWPSYKTMHYTTPKGGWEITETIGSQTLGQALFDPTVTIETYIGDLARHAALGDALGRGDRHLENYIVSDNQLLPVDISYLFWLNNDSWLATYIHAGITEINALTYLPNPSPLIDLFFEHYFETLTTIYAKRSDLLLFSQSFIHTSSLAGNLSLLLNSVLSKWIQNPNDRITWYTDQLQIATKNQDRKKRLIAQIEADPSLLDRHPDYKMIYLADKDYHSAFFMQKQDIINQIDATLDATRQPILS